VRGSWGFSQLLCEVECESDVRQSLTSRLGMLGGATKSKGVIIGVPSGALARKAYEGALAAEEIGPRN
jgi:hypothetical protein